jgi:hypothetical protein
MTKDEILVRVASRYFISGIVLRDGLVVKAAPILRYMIGWSSSRAVGYIDGKGWCHDFLGCLQTGGGRQTN